MEIRLVRGQSPGAGDSLIERGMDAPVGADFGQQSLSVGGAQLFDFPIPQQGVDEGMRVAEAQEALGVGGVAGLGALLRHELELFEKDSTQLVGGVDIELLPREHLDLGLEPARLRAQLFADGRQPGHVYRDTGDLHLGEHTHEWTFHVVIQACGASFLQELTNSWHESSQHRHLARSRLGIVGHAAGRRLRDLGAAAAEVKAKLLRDRSAPRPGVLGAESGHKASQTRQGSLALSSVEEVGSDRGVEIQPGELNALWLEHPHQLFGPVGDDPGGAVEAFGEHEPEHVGNGRLGDHARIHPADLEGLVLSCRLGLRASWAWTSAVRVVERREGKSFQLGAPRAAGPDRLDGNRGGRSR